MRLRNVQSLRLIAGLAAATALLAIVAVISMTGANSSPPLASATGPTPTKIPNAGTLGGVVDILIHAGGSTGLFTCMGKVDHDDGSDLIKTALQCYVDISSLESSAVPPTWADTICGGESGAALTKCLLHFPSTIECQLLLGAARDTCLADLDEAGADDLAGPPPPPPYKISPPSKAIGTFYPTGHPDCDAKLPFWGPNDPCTIQTACFEDLNIVIGPNVIAKIYIGDPEDLGGYPAPNDGAPDGESHGKVDVYYNQANSTCKTGDPKGSPNLGSVSITTWDVYDKAGTANVSSPWRIANANGSADPTHDYDGDGCWDDAELDKSYVAPGSGVKCGDDPFNPTDSFDAATVDLTGVYKIVSRLARWDCSNAQDCVNSATPGIYTTCLAEMRHDTQTHDLVMRPYCYADQTSVQTNQEAYPGSMGDGINGGAPPGPAVVTPCGTFTGPPLSGEPPCNYVYGDVDAKHAELAGSFNPTTNDLVVAGCFIDQDGLGGVGDVWFEINVSAHQLPGTASIRLFQNEDCVGSPTGPPIPSVVTFVKLPDGLARDDDQDGIPTAAELQDDSVCGLRDPFNKNDFYDVSIPRDGKIDLFSDIAGVIANYAPFGYNSGQQSLSGAPGTMENFDRPPAMQGGNPWNYGSPDGKIDLFNDIAGVIAMYTPFGCPPTA